MPTYLPTQFDQAIKQAGQYSYPDKNQTPPSATAFYPTPTGELPTTAPPITKTPGVITTDNVRNDFATQKMAIQKQIDEVNAQLKVKQEELKAKQAEDAQAKLKEKPKETNALDELKSAGLYTPPVKTPEELAVEKQKKVIEDINSQITTASTAMDNWQIVRNKKTVSMIENIKQQYATRAREVTDIYNRQEASYNQLGIRLGSRYSAGGTMMDDVITKVENQKIQQLNDLDVQMNGLILQAQSAADDNDFKLLSQKMSSLQDAQKTAQNAMIDLQKETLKRNQEIEAEKQTIKKQSSIGMLLGKGYSVEDIMATGQFNEDDVNGVLDAVLKSQKTSNETSLTSYTNLKGERIQPFFNPATGEYREVKLGKTQLSEQEKQKLDLEQYQKQADIQAQKEMNVAGYKESLGGTTSGLTSTQRTYLNGIQSDAMRNDDIKVFSSVKGSYQQGVDAYNRATTGGGQGIGDIVLMRTLAKITDPTSSVREEEFETFKSAQSTFSRFGIKITKEMFRGDKLTQSGRDQMLSMLQDIYNTRKQNYDFAYQFYDKQAVDAGIPSGQVIPYSPDSTTKDEKSKSVKIGGKDVAVGTIIQNSKGQKGKVEADGSITPIK